MNNFYNESLLKISTFVVILLFINIPLKAQISGYIGNDKPVYDFSDFKPITPQKFVKQNFKKLQEQYKIDPSILDRGYRIEVIPAKRKGFRPSVRTNQLFAQLVEDAALEWAKQNNYKVYRENGYEIEQKLSNGTKINININPSFWGPKYNKTIEKEFDENHSRLYTNANGDFSLINKRYSTIHGLKSYESEVTGISDKKFKDEYLKKISELIQSGKTDKETDITTLKTYANYFNGGIEIIISKYGDVSGVIEKNQNQKGISVDLTPLKLMINSMFSFCDQKINDVIKIFMAKMKK